MGPPFGVMDTGESTLGYGWGQQKNGENWGICGLQGLVLALKADTELTEGEEGTEGSWREEAGLAISGSEIGDWLSYSGGSYFWMAMVVSPWR
jgi:hypothetical protein